jgi:hypothetical protein
MTLLPCTCIKRLTDHVYTKYGESETCTGQKASLPKVQIQISNRGFWRALNLQAKAVVPGCTTWAQKKQLFRRVIAIPSKRNKPCELISGQDQKQKHQKCKSSRQKTTQHVATHVAYIGIYPYDGGFVHLQMVDEPPYRTRTFEAA